MNKKYLWSQKKSKKQNMTKYPAASRDCSQVVVSGFPGRAESILFVLKVGFLEILMGLRDGAKPPPSPWPLLR